MKHLIIIFTIVLVGNFVFASGSQSKDLIKTFDVNKGTELMVQINPGDITVQTWKTNQVKVTVKGLRASEYDDVSMEMRNNRLIVEYDESSGINDAEFVFTVPTNFHMRLNTTGGDIKINDKIIGKVSINTAGGDIETEDMQGKLSCKTMGGDIKLGNINGELNASTHGGDIKVGIITGKSASVTTMGGDLIIDEAANGAKLETMGGDIHANAVDGWIKATTMGGEVNITMVGDPDKGDRSVFLKSMGGDITLTVPEGLSMELDLDITYDRRHEDDVEIISDFEFEEERTEEWTDDNSPKKHIYGTGTVNGGKHRIKIKTINGKIFLKKN